MDLRIIEGGASFLEELRQLVRETWTAALKPPPDLLKGDMAEQFAEVERGVALAVIQYVLPRFMLARSKEDVLLTPVRDAGDTLFFGDWKHEALFFEWRPAGLRVTLALAVLWPGATSYQRVSGWSTISKENVQFLRDKLDAWLESPKKEGGGVWHAASCGSPECVKRGVLFDTRITLAVGEQPLLGVRCPLCGEASPVRGAWEEDEGGYGSRRDWAVRASHRVSMRERDAAFVALERLQPGAVAALLERLSAKS